MNSKEKKLSLIIMILILVVISLTIYIIYDKKGDSDSNNNNNGNEIENNNDNQDNNETPDDEKVEELDINSEEVKKLYGHAKLKEKIDNAVNNEAYDNYLSIEECIYSKKEITPKDFNSCESNKFSFAINLRFFIQSASYNFEYKKYKNKYDYTENIEIKKKELEKVLYILYGDNYTINDLNSYIYLNENEMNEVVKYNKDNDSYMFYGNGGSVTDADVETKLIKAEKEKDYIYLYEKVGLSSRIGDTYYSNLIGLYGYSYYKDYNKEFIEKNKDREKKLNGKSIWEYEDDLSTYRFVFKKDEAGEYHLESMGYFIVK